MSKSTRNTQYTGPASSDPAAVAGLSARLSERVSPLQAEVDACVQEADALSARRRAAQLARVPLQERISPILKAVPTQEDA